MTSGTRRLAGARIEACGFPSPPALVTGDDVAEGKPHPAGYAQAAESLGVSAADCVVFEDAPAGIEAGRAAGARVIALATTYDLTELGAADGYVDTLAQVSLATQPAGTIVLRAMFARVGWLRALGSTIRSRCRITRASRFDYPEQSWRSEGFDRGRLRNNGDRLACRGHSYQLGNEGSAYWIGVAAARAASRATIEPHAGFG